MSEDRSSGTTPALQPRSLTIASFVTVIAVAAALVVALAFGTRAPSQDEAALRAVLAGAATSSGSTSSGATTTDAGADSARSAAAPTATPPSPTAIPAPATATAIPPPAPTIVPPTVAPAATPGPAEPPPESSAPPLPTPVPTTEEGNNEIRQLPAGRVTVPVGPGISFELSRPHDSIHLPGISALYVREDPQSEVDIFVPVATASGERLRTFDEVVAHVNSDPLFSRLRRWSQTEWNGLRTAGFEGRGTTDLELGFYTDPARIGDPATGWRMPDRLEIWFIDTPSGPIAITSEALAAATEQEFTATIDLMLEILESLEILG